MKGVVKMMYRCPKARIDEKSHHDSDNIVIDVPVWWDPSGVRSAIADRDEADRLASIYPPNSIVFDYHYYFKVDMDEIVPYNTQIIVFGTRHK